MAKSYLMRGIDKTAPYRRLWIGLVMVMLILPTFACQAGSGNVDNDRVATEVVVAPTTVPQVQTEEVVQSIEEPTQAPTNTAIPTATPTPTDLPTPTATLVPTITPRPTIGASAPEPTFTPTQFPPTDTPTIVTATPIPTTPIPSPTPQVVVNNAVPELVEPTDNANISQDMYTFVWRWPGAALTNDQAFEVRIWREGEPHYGAFDARETSKYLEQRDTGNALTFSVSSAYSVQQNGIGEYFWSVAVVQLEPYQLVVESAPRPIMINVLGGQDEGDGGGHSYE